MLFNTYTASYRRFYRSYKQKPAGTKTRYSFYTNTTQYLTTKIIDQQADQLEVAIIYLKTAKKKINGTFQNQDQRENKTKLMKSK